MKKVMEVFLGVLTAIGGFVDIGDLVANAVVGARFGMSLAWVVVVGVVGICLFADMSGRVAAVTGRGTFDLVRERLGPRIGLLNLGASMLVTFLARAGEQRQLPVARAAGRLPHLAGHLADAVPEDGAGLRPGRSGPARLRGGSVAARP
jgi:hypothetical protein